MDLFGLKKKREQKHLDFINSLKDKDDKHLYDTYCDLDMDIICGNKNKYTKKEISAVVDELKKRGYVNELGQIYPYKVKKSLKLEIKEFIQELKSKTNNHIVDIYNEESIKPLAISSSLDRLKCKAIADELKDRGYMTSTGVLTFPILINYSSLKEWNLENFGLIDNIQFNGFDLFVTGENQTLRIYGEEDEYGETTVKLSFVNEALEREELQYIEMNSELAYIDISTLSAMLTFTDGSSIDFEFKQILENDDYSLDNLTLKANYSYK